MCLGFRDWGLGIRVEGLGSRVEGLGIKKASGSRIKLSNRDLLRSRDLGGLGLMFRT